MFYDSVNLAEFISNLKSKSIFDLVFIWVIIIILTVITILNYYNKIEVMTSLILENQRSKLLLDCASDITFQIDTNKVYTYIDGPGMNTFNIKREDIIGKTYIEYMGKSAHERIVHIDAALNGYRNTYYWEAESKKQKYHFETIVAPLYNVEGIITGIIGVSKDITDKKKKEEEVIFAYEHDDLTGLYNRRYFENIKEKFDNESSLPLSIIIGDINGLKLVNNAFGVSKGDQLLKEIASIIVSSCREQDIIVKLGGDEFGIMLPNTEKTVALEIMKKIQSKCGIIDILDMNLKSSSIISFGTSTRETMLISLSDSIKVADDNLSRRKLLESNTSQNIIMKIIKATMIERCLETEEHSERLSITAKKIGKALSLSDSELDNLEVLSKLHDIGKIGVDDKILNKTGKLDELEWIEMKKHPEIGYRIAISSSDLVPIAEDILSHHEKWDGTGYPQKLSGDSIPLLSRIISIVDAYDAMTHDRPYQKAIPKDAALSEIKKCSGTQFDPSIVSLFIEMDLD